MGTGLADKVANNNRRRGEREEVVSKDVAARQEGMRADLFKQLTTYKAEFAKALPDRFGVDRFLRNAWTVCRTPEIVECEPMSVIGGLMSAAQLGLELGGVLGEAFLIKRKNVATFMIGYKGMATLSWRHPLVVGMTTATVWEKDEFAFDRAMGGVTKHEPYRLDDPQNDDRGQAIFWWAKVWLRNGGWACSVLDRGEVERRRSFSTAPEWISPWKHHYNQMAEKSAFRDMWDLAPRTTDLTYALAWEGNVRDNPDLDALQDPPDPSPVEAERLDEEQPAPANGAHNHAPGDSDPSCPECRKTFGPNNP